ncbi:MAG: DedA family protein [Candidatus Dormibacteria bacterium]
MTATAQLPGVFHTLAPILDHYGYLAVGGLVLMEDFGVPVPGETVLIAAALYAGAGRLNVVAVAMIAFVAAVVGDNIGYAIGHFGGRELALRWGRYAFLTPDRLSFAEEFFRRHGGKVVTVARFIEGLRQANGIIAGISKLPWLARFVPYNVLGAALWVGLWTAIGYTAGAHIAVLYNQIVSYELYLAFAVALLLCAYVGYRFWSWHRRPSLAEDTGAEAEAAKAEADPGTREAEPRKDGLGK